MTKKYIFYYFVVIFLVACNPQDNDTFELSGTIYDYKTNEAIHGAKIELYDDYGYSWKPNLYATFITVNDGKYNFDIHNSFGEFLLKITCNGYYDTAQVFEADYDRDVKIDFLLKPLVTTNEDGNIFQFTGLSLSFNNISLTQYNISKPFINIDIENIMINNPTISNNNIDIVLCSDNTFSKSLCSPNANLLETVYNSIDPSINYSKNDKYNTKLQKVYFEYDLITAQQLNNLIIIPDYIGGNVSNGIGVTNLEINDLIAFETQDGIKGVIKITTINKNTANMVVDIKLLVL